MKGKIPTVGRTARYHEHVIDGQTVRSNLSAEDLAEYPEAERLALLRRMLANTPKPRPAEETA